MEKRIYVVVAATVQVPAIPNSNKPPLRIVVQPEGRQIAQACHIANELRLDVGHRTNEYDIFFPTTTIILQSRDSKELFHVFKLLNKKHLNPVMFSDDNPDYGPGSYPTAVAVYATQKQVENALDYLPLWGVQ